MINPNVETHAQSLANYMPSGRLFEAKNIKDSNFRQLLRGLAFELFTAQGYLITLEQEYFPDLTTLFLSEWEQALGIPDDCFPGTGTVLERRRDILVKLSALGVQTSEDFVVLAAVFGLTITASPLSDDPVLIAELGISEVDARYITVFDGEGFSTNVPPYDVPFDVEARETILVCLLNKQVPSNVNGIYRNP